MRKHARNAAFFLAAILSGGVVKIFRLPINTKKSAQKAGKSAQKAGKSAQKAGKRAIFGAQLFKLFKRG